ncbi:glycosyltransferase family 8 protein [Pedobacter sp. MC2016-14]|uniref:glycosyltransferase family 8 protein n=1 Tax=Pedobacter sp. MC2016-14 TaxID=2897327 RepID=UPI001E619121|nr:glycosyltransferase family 8 protein [Pedobacter sp. MC2016-14]MCD0490211.1 glycosyltransferase family 8 protein [Pedobacter sp. MC2016-14]
MKNKENITIVVASDDHFAIMLAALIQSIIHTHKSGEKIDLYIVDDNLSTANLEKINSSYDPEKINIKWLKLTEIFAGVKLPLDNSTFPLNVYMRLFIPLFLPKEVKKAIFLDVDMILCTDISELWNIDLGSYPIAAVRDRSEIISNEWGGITNYKELGLHPDLPYFNAGMMVLNNEIWRENGITQKIIECITTNVKYANFPDQYGLNVILAGQFYELDFRWNCYSILDEKNPYIIHFIGNKPIYKSYNSNVTYAEEFFKYVRLTAWKDFSPHSSYKRYLKKAINKIKKKLNIR